MPGCRFPGMDQGRPQSGDFGTVTGQGMINQDHVRPTLSRQRTIKENPWSGRHFSWFPKQFTLTLNPVGIDLRETCRALLHPAQRVTSTFAYRPRHIRRLAPDVENLLNSTYARFCPERVNMFSNSQSFRLHTDPAVLHSLRLCENYRAQCGPTTFSPPPLT